MVCLDYFLHLRMFISDRMKMFLKFGVYTHSSYLYLKINLSYVEYVSNFIDNCREKNFINLDFCFFLPCVYFSSNSTNKLLYIRLSGYVENYLVYNTKCSKNKLLKMSVLFPCMEDKHDVFIFHSFFFFSVLYSAFEVPG